MSLHESTSQEEYYTSAPQRPLMRADLVKAAIEGNQNDLTRLLGLQGEECSHDHEVKLELQIRSAPDQFETTVENVEAIQSATHFGNTILHILATCGHSDLVSMCYRKEPALLTSQNDKLETPLHCAAKAGHHEVILKLIEHARNEGEVGLKEFLRDRNCNEETALYEAARHGHATIVSVLMQEDPDLAGIVNNEKVSPLYMATARGSIDVVQIMVENMSDRLVGPEFYAGPNGQTALHAAVLRDAGPEIQEQLSRFELKIRDLITKLEQNQILKVLRNDKHSILSHNFTPLILQLRSVSPLPLPREADDTKNTPLHFAASFGCNHLVELLLGHDLSLGYLRNKDELCPIHVAASKGHVKTIIVFLRRCIDSHELLDSSGKNFFHIAAEENRLQVFTKLLGKPMEKLGIPGRDDEIFRNMINSGDSGGDTPLHLSVLKGNRSIIRALLKYKGLDLGLQNKAGLTAVDLSVIEDQKKSADMEGLRSLIEKYVKIWGIQFSPACFQLNRDEQISKTDSMEVRKNSINVTDKIQVIGLGSVLIATVAFAAPFTMPGQNSDNGTPISERRYSFKAFILADLLAFLASFLSIIQLIFCCTMSLHQNTMEKKIQSCLEAFSLAAKYLALTLALGLYVVLSPISSHLWIIACTILSLLFLVEPRIYTSLNIYNTNLFINRRPKVATQRLVKSGRIFHLLRHIWYVYAKMLAPLLFVFLYALY